MELCEEGPFYLIGFENPPHNKRVSSNELRNVYFFQIRFARGSDYRQPIHSIIMKVVHCLIYGPLSHQLLKMENNASE